MAITKLYVVDFLLCTSGTKCIQRKLTGFIPKMVSKVLMMTVISDTGGNNDIVCSRLVHVIEITSTNILSGMCCVCQQIDGEAFLLLNQTDIVRILKIKLGPAIKIYNSILMIRNNMDVQILRYDNWLC